MARGHGYAYAHAIDRGLIPRGRGVVVKQLGPWAYVYAPHDREQGEWGASAWRVATWPPI
jgi:hypothetical protein